jgi:Putative auto-transporter adhesin, head GIN domain
MKKIMACLFFLGAVFIANAQKEIVNDANAELRIINGSFNNIKISGGIDLFLSQSDDEAVAVSASENKFKDGIKTIVENNTLKIYYLGNRSWNSEKKSLRIYLSFKTIEKIEATAACDIQVAGSIAVPSLKLSLSGASDFKGAVNVTDLKMDLSGASDVIIKGIAKTVNIESSGASDVKGYDLITSFCNVKASGASDVQITVNSELNVNASGSSDISYKGDAVIKEKHTSGASGVTKKS